MPSWNRITTAASPLGSAEVIDRVAALPGTVTHGERRLGAARQKDQLAEPQPGPKVISNADGCPVDGSECA